MWTKTQLIIALIATTDLIDDFDYFLLGGDDMYVLVDNLKMFLNSNRIKQISGIIFSSCKFNIFHFMLSQWTDLHWTTNSRQPIHPV